MYHKIRRILAAAAVIFLLGLYLAAFISAVTGSGISSVLFKASIFCSVVIPAGVYGFLLVLRAASERKSNKQPQKKTEKEEDEDPTRTP